jgi:hypothetical protein
MTHGMVHDSFNARIRTFLYGIALINSDPTRKACHMPNMRALLFALSSEPNGGKRAERGGFPVSAQRHCP